MSEGSSPNLRRAARLVAAALIAVCAGLLAPVVVSSPARSLEPPRTHELARYRADGSLTARLRAARRLGDQRVSAALVRGLEARLRAAQLGLEPAAFMPPPAWRGMPTSGTVKMLALLVSFKDYPRPTAPAAPCSAKLFGAGNAAAIP